MAKLKVALLVFAEGDFYSRIPSPHFNRLDILKWKINRLAGRLFRYANPSINGIKNIVESLKENKIPAIFCIAGHLYLKKCDGWEEETHALKPRNKWYKRIIGDWYYWDRGGDYKSNQGFYFGDFIEREMKDEILFALGLHGFAHEALTLEDREVLDSIIRKGIEAAKKLGIRIKIFGAPFEMIEEEKDKDKIFDILKKYRIKNVAYTGMDNGFVRKRKYLLNKIVKRNGLNFIWITNDFEGVSSKKRINEIKRDILLNKNKEGVYCISTHDFTHKSRRNIGDLARFLEKLKMKGEIELLNLNELRSR